MKNLVRIFFMLPLVFFFQKKYLSSRHFNDSLSGFRFAARAIWQRSILRLAKPMPFPASAGYTILSSSRIHFHPDDLNNFQMNGTYYQNFSADIWLGKGTYIASNVGIITANHDVLNLDNHVPGKDVVIGKNCWVGMNCVILPGVTLGDRTIVGAGSVVTKSFPEGNCVLAGNPAKVIRKIV